ncbi:MAG TPA: formylglycine-generating enzyme family protein [Verrucomicrobiales bacterium]|nr:formylglycine-generating enzyme family protein [Verrucomicrobiales bacterium]
MIAALAGTVLGVLLLGGAWKLGWLGWKGTAEEIVFDLGKGVRMTFCWCPAGTFLMGSPAAEPGRSWMESQHPVTLTRGFWMAKTETTQKQWRALMPDNPSHFKGEGLPVENVTWDEATEFAAALTGHLRKKGKLDRGWEFRLPTEAQWEYACRAGTTTVYCTGDGEAALQRASWYNGNSEGSASRLAEWFQSYPTVAGWFRRKSERKTWPVGRKTENAFGLQDMHGNVWEWCQDWYGDYAEGSVADPIGPRAGVVRVVRGGSWLSGAGDCRSASRSGDGPGHRGAGRGFRVCLVPESLPYGEPLAERSEGDESG